MSVLLSPSCVCAEPQENLTSSYTFIIYNMRSNLVKVNIFSEKYFRQRPFALIHEIITPFYVQEQEKYFLHLNPTHFTYFKANLTSILQIQI